ASGQLDVAPLVSHRFRLEQAVEAYDLLSSGEPSLGILLQYPQDDAARLAQRTVALDAAPPAAAGGSQAGQACSMAFLGAGNYAGRVLIPAFKAAGATLRTVVSSGGVSAVHYGRKHGFAQASTDSAAVMEDAAVDTVVVATRHNAHALQVLAALRAGK